LSESAKIKIVIFAKSLIKRFIFCSNYWMLLDEITTIFVVIIVLKQKLQAYSVRHNK